jgi:outer membrane lipoprotein-sorting protein
LLVASLAALLRGGPAGADPDPVKILRDSIQKEIRASFVGQQETTVTNGANVERTEQIVKRKPPNRQRVEFLAPPRLHGDVMLDDGTTTWYLFHALNEVEQGASTSKAARPLLNQLANSVKRGNATLEYLGEDTIAGRKAQGVRITPARQPNRHRDVWLDEDYGVVLRARDAGPGTRTSDTVFKRIEFDPSLPESDFVWETPPGVIVVPSGQGTPVPMQRANQIAKRNWGALLLPKTLPPRFLLRSAREVRIMGQPVIHLRFSDGQRTLSLFQSLVGGPTLEPGPAGPKNNLLPLRRGRVNLLLVGPLPIPELQKVADSIQ